MNPDGIVVTGRFGEYLEELRQTWKPRPGLMPETVKHGPIEQGLRSESLSRVQ